MKKYLLILTAFVCVLTTRAQSPQNFSFQAVIRNASNNLIVSSPIGIKTSILQGSASGTAIYVETQAVSTNVDGLVSVQIGNGTVVTGTFSTINWGAGPFFLKTETDPSGGTNYTISGTSQLLSVPYALYANSSGASKSGWTLTGNLGTVDGTNFIGTSDMIPVNIRMNNKPSGRIDSASGNTYYGYKSGNFPTATGIQNTVIGMQSLQNNTSGTDNTAAGYHSLVNNTTGGNNVGYGFCSLVGNTTGSSNTSIGNWTLFKNTASYNTAIGDSALYSNTSGTGNAAMGYQALTANTTGIQNTVIGMQSLLFNTSGSDNTAAGYHSLVNNTTGGNNVGYGFCSLVGNTTGSSNTSIGNWTLFKNTASYNTAIGDSALYSNTSGTGNAAMGYQALTANTIGSNNTAIGNGALMSNTSGSNNTALGNLSDVGSSNSNSTAIGYQATASENDVIVLGNSSIQKLYCAQTTITAISDGRFKNNIRDDIHGLDFILKLKPISYNLNITKLNGFQGKKTNESDEKSIKQAEEIRHNGFIAQDVETAAKAVNYNFSGLKSPQNSGDIYGLGYTDFVVPLVKSVQELNANCEKLRAENTLLKTLLLEQSGKLTGLQDAQQLTNKEIAELKKLIDANSMKAEVLVK